MIGRRPVHDRRILDALETIEPERFTGEAWRVTRKGRDPLRGSTANGRWSPSGGEFEVLYTSLERDGALAEIGYRLSLEPVWPSRIEHQVHRIEVETEGTLRFVDRESLARLGVDIARYHTFEYQATQAIAAAAYFLEFDSLIVPSARFHCPNLVIFTERATGLVLRKSDAVDWDAWRRRRVGE
ncbi:MAG: RES family NAD+ phosphorylase [Alphaproteobacteria bacterium]|nr:RES family NAD+ phosphorylase [Alphaproteobacteria bacterium]